MASGVGLRRASGCGEISAVIDDGFDRSISERRILQIVRGRCLTCCCLVTVAASYVSTDVRRFSLIAACAAASLAIGILNGLQLILSTPRV